MSFPRVWSIGILVIGLCLSFSSAIRAAEPATQGTTYQVDTNASRIFVKVGSANSLGHPHGVEARLTSGRLDLGGDGEFVFDMGSFTADTPESRKRAGLEVGKISASDAKKVTQTMRSDEVLGVTRFPTATFQMAAVTAADGQASGALGLYQLEGTFRLHGTEKKLQLRARLEGTPQGHMRLTGTFAIKQSDYGIKPYSTFGGIVKVADELEISGDLLLVPVK